MTDTSKYKNRLHEYLNKRGIEIRNIDGADRIHCPDPSHHDENPSAVVYDEVVYCPVCSATWDIFETAGLIRGLKTFPEKLKEVQNALGEMPEDDYKKPPVQKAKPKKEKKKTHSTPVPVPFEKRNEIFNAKMLLERAIKYGWGKEIAGAWGYKDKDGNILIVDVRFEGGQRKKNVMTFYYDGHNVKSKSYPVILFNLDKIAKNPDMPILIHEGAKCAQAAEVIPGFISTAWNGGAKKYKYVDWSVLKGRDIFIWPDDDPPGMEVAYKIKEEYFPNAKIIPPSLRAREIKEKGADIVEVLEIATPQQIAKYILESDGVELPVSSPPTGSPEPVRPSPVDDGGSTPSDSKADDYFPFKVLGTADDGKGYFLDRSNRLYGFKLDSINKQKLFKLAPLSWWRNQYSYDGKVSWDGACDEIIELAGNKDFDLSEMRGRGAWKDKMGYCYNDGIEIIGKHDPDMLYIKKSRKDIGLKSKPIDHETLEKMAFAIQGLSFQTSADAVRCMTWATIAPFGGALPWRPAFLLTGDSGSGKTTVANHVIRPIAFPEWLDGGETTVAGVRGSTKNDTEPVVFEEAESGDNKRGRNREDLFSLMVSSTSDDAPDARKGTKDQGFTSYGMRKMFGFISISTEVVSAAALNRLIWINMERAHDSAERWQEKEALLHEIMTLENCNALRSRTWKLLPTILKMVKPVAIIIQSTTKKDYRFSYAESILLSTYFVVWKNIKESDDKFIKPFIEEFYSWQPPEEKRDETAEIIDRLLDESVQVYNSHGAFLTLREILQAQYYGYIETGNESDVDGKKFLSKTEIINYKRTSHRYGIALVSGTSDIAIATNHHEIMRILNRGAGYQRQLWRHKGMVDKNRRISIAGKTRTCVVLKDILEEIPI